MVSRLDDGMDQVLRHFLIVGEQLFRVLRQAIAAVTERWIVVVVADTRVEADPLDDLFRIEPVGGRVVSSSLK